MDISCHRSDGHSRQFGFVGFKSAEDAQAALDYFNNSYLDTSRLNIQVSCGVKELCWVNYHQSHMYHMFCCKSSEAGRRYTAMPVPQFAYQRGAEALPRAWSRYTPGTTANAQQAARQHPAEAAAEQPRKDKKQTKAKQREPGMAAYCMPPCFSQCTGFLCHPAVCSAALC